MFSAHENYWYWFTGWDHDDVIVFAGHIRGPLHRIAAFGGTPALVTPQPEPDSSQLHCWPVFLPGGDRFLFFVNRTGPRDALRHGIYAGSLSLPEVQVISADIDGNLAYACAGVFPLRVMPTFHLTQAMIRIESIRIYFLLSRATKPRGGARTYNFHRVGPIALNT
jgi:hypothetical protein